MTKTETRLFYTDFKIFYLKFIIIVSFVQILISYPFYNYNEKYRINFSYTYKLHYFVNSNKNAMTHFQKRLKKLYTRKNQPNIKHTTKQFHATRNFLSYLNILITLIIHNINPYTSHDV